MARFAPTAPAPQAGAASSGTVDVTLGKGAASKAASPGALISKVKRNDSYLTHNEAENEKILRKPQKKQREMD